MAAHSLSSTASTQSAGSTLESAARQALAGYPSRYQPQMSKIAASAQAGFSGACVFRVETPCGAYCLRAAPAAACNTARLAGLHRLLAHVAARGVEQVSVPVGRDDGATFVVLDGVVWQFEPWMPGAADFQTRPSIARLKNAAACLARWHLAAADFRCDSEEQPWFCVSPAAPSPGLCQRLQTLHERVEHLEEFERLVVADDWSEFRELGLAILACFRRVAPLVAGELRLAVQSEIALQPCLRDVWHDHVLFTGDSVTGLIDAHACRSDSVATDLARLLGSLVGDDRVQWEVFLSAYEELRPLSLEERALVEIFDRSAVCLSGLTWLDWRYRERRALKGQQRVLQRLGAIIDRLQALAGGRQSFDSTIRPG